MLLGGTDSDSRASETMTVLNLFTVNFPCVHVQLCLMNIQIGTPHTSEGFLVFFFLFSEKAIVFFFFKSIFEFSDGEIAIIITTTAHTKKQNEIKKS